MSARAKSGSRARLAESTVMCFSRSVSNALAATFLTLLVATGSTTVVAQDGRFPFDPPDTASPRGTLFNLIDNVAEAYRVLAAAKRDYAATPSLFKGDAVLEQQARAEGLLRRAAESLDLNQVSPVIRRHVSLEAALQLKEVLDRIQLPSAETIPDAQAVKAQALTRWRIPHTSIDIVQVAEGPRAGEFLFDPRTVAQAAPMYQSVRHLPYVTPGTERFYEDYVSSPGSLLPPKWLAWVETLPAWSKTFYYGKTLWQWSALMLTLLIVFSVPYGLSRWLRRRSEPDSEVLRVLRRLLVPSAILLGLLFARYFLVQQINFTGQGLNVVLRSLLVPMVLIEAYIAYLLATLVAEGIISSPRIDNASLDANMMRMAARVLGVGFGIVIVFYAANQLGVPLLPLVASLGVGGIAVALAARPTLENLIGGVILYTDRPVRVGDFCSFGDNKGHIERIGVRSTQIRALDRTVITVPNAAFADMQIINWARCDRMLILATIGLRYETKPEQLRYVLAKLREMFLAHPEIDNDTRRIRFLGYGSSSLEVQIRVYALTRDWNEYFAIQEDVMLRVGEIVEQAGTGFAFPSQTLYVRRDDGLDKERSDAAMHQVQSWRSAGQLPFPHMARSHRERLADTLDYPPRGSPDAHYPQTQQDEAAEPLSDETEGDGQPGDQPGGGEGTKEKLT